MSSPLPAFAKLEPAGNVSWERAGALTLQTSDQAVPNPFLHSQVSRALQNFKYIRDNSDRNLSDYILVGLLSVLIHNTVVDHFDRTELEQEIVEPIKQESKVQITLTRPQPKPVAPPPQVKPQPPKPKVVPLKPQKPKPTPKVAEEAPPPVPNPVISDAPSAPVSAAPAAPAVEEKVTPPVAGADYLNNPAPEYPEIAQERGWEGKVQLKVHVQPDGKPDKITVIKSSGQQVLDDEAIKTVYKWSFVPAKRGETPIAGYVTVPISFNL